MTYIPNMNGVVDPNQPLVCVADTRLVSSGLPEADVDADDYIHVSRGPKQYRDKDGTIKTAPAVDIKISLQRLEAMLEWWESL